MVTHSVGRRSRNTRAKSRAFVSLSPRSRITRCPAHTCHPPTTRFTDTSIALTGNFCSACGSGTSAAGEPVGFAPGGAGGASGAGGSVCGGWAGASEPGSPPPGRPDIGGAIGIAGDGIRGG